MGRGGARRDGYGDLTFYRKPHSPPCRTTRGAISLRRIIRRRYCHARTPHGNRLNGDVLFYTYVSSGARDERGPKGSNERKRSKSNVVLSDVCAVGRVYGECGTKTKVLTFRTVIFRIAGAMRFRRQTSNTISDSQTYAVAKP